MHDLYCIPVSLTKESKEVKGIPGVEIVAEKSATWISYIEFVRTSFFREIQNIVFAKA